MCIVSAVVNDWIMPGSPNYIPGLHPYAPLPPAINSELARDMKRALEILDRIDKKLGNTQCAVDEKAKKALMEEFYQRIHQGT